jgi:hypothetical protein
MLEMHQSDRLFKAEGQKKKSDSKLRKQHFQIVSVNPEEIQASLSPSVFSKKQTSKFRSWREKKRFKKLFSNLNLRLTSQGHREILWCDKQKPWSKVEMEKSSVMRGPQKARNFPIIVCLKHNLATQESKRFKQDRAVWRVLSSKTYLILCLVVNKARMFRFLKFFLTHWFSKVASSFLSTTKVFKNLKLLIRWDVHNSLTADSNLNNPKKIINPCTCLCLSKI